MRGALFSSSISWRLAKVMVLSIVANHREKNRTQFWDDHSNRFLHWFSFLSSTFFFFFLKRNLTLFHELTYRVSSVSKAGGEFVYLSIYLDFDAIFWICCQFSLLSRSLEQNMFYQHGSLLGVQKRSSYYKPMCAWVWEFLHLITRKCEFSVI